MVSLLYDVYRVQTLWYDDSMDGLKETDVQCLDLELADLCLADFKKLKLYLSKKLGVEIDGVVESSSHLTLDCCSKIVRTYFMVEPDSCILDSSLDEKERFLAMSFLEKSKDMFMFEVVNSENMKLWTARWAALKDSDRIKGLMEKAPDNGKGVADSYEMMSRIQKLAEMPAEQMEIEAAMMGVV